MKQELGDLTGLNVLIIGRSNLVGKPLAKMLTDEDCTVTLAHSKTKGLYRQMGEADVVVSARLSYHDVWCGKPNKIGQVMDMPAEYAGDAKLLEKALEADDESSTRVVPGLLVTGDQFIDTDEARAKILANFPDAIAVDMESAALAHVCYLKKIPFLSFRVISDVPGESGNNTEIYENFWDTMADKSFGITKKFLENLS
jgi:adenosylhomocysteine nucleosidase